jgi:hypothetical protein
MLGFFFIAVLFGGHVCQTDSYEDQLCSSSYRLVPYSAHTLSSPTPQKNYTETLRTPKYNSFAEHNCIASEE